MTWTSEDAGVSPAFDARETAAQVAADMNAAFGAWVDGESGAAARGVRPPHVDPGEAGGSPRRARLNLLTAVSVGVLVGVSVGALIARPHRTPAPSSPASAEVSAPLAQSATVGLTAPGRSRRLRVETEPYAMPQASSPRLAEASPPTLQASPAALGRIAAGPERYPDDGFWSGRKSAPQTAPPPRRAAQDASSATYAPAERLAQSSPSPFPPAAGGQSDCFGQGAERRRVCLIAATGRADAALRASYRQAAMAGVPNEVLEQDTQSWNDMRWRGGAEPEQMIAGYRRLAATLRAQTAAARRDRLAQDRGYGWPGQPYPPYSPWD